MRLLTLIALVLILFSCREKAAEDLPPSNLIPLEEFSLVMTDVQLMEATFNQKMFREDDPRVLMARFYEQIFEKHGINRAAFDSSYNYYADRPKDMMRVYELVINELSKQEEGVNSISREAEKSGMSPEQLEQGASSGD